MGPALAALSALQERAGEGNYPLCASELQAAGRVAGSLCQVAGGDASTSRPLRGEGTCRGPAVLRGDTKACCGEWGQTEPRGFSRRLTCEDEPFLAASGPAPLFTGTVLGAGLWVAPSVPTRALCGRCAQRPRRVWGQGQCQGLAQGHSHSGELMYTKSVSSEAGLATASARAARAQPPRHTHRVSTTGTEKGSAAQKGLETEELRPTDSCNNRSGSSNSSSSLW